jgi:hypothetical protein
MAYAYSPHLFVADAPAPLLVEVPLMQRRGG